MAVANTLIQVDGLVKSYGGRKVVDGVMLQAERGEIVGLLGPNGAGKTTTFYMIVGLVKPERGRILFEGRNITRLPMYKRARIGVGYLAQEPSVFRKLTVEENVMAILETLDITPAERRRRLTEHLEYLDIGRVAKQRPTRLAAVNAGAWRSRVPS